MSTKDSKRSLLYKTSDDLLELSPEAIKTLFWLIPRVLSGGFNSDIPEWDHQLQTVINLEEGYEKGTGIDTSAARYPLLELLKALEKRAYFERFKIEHASDWMRGIGTTPYGQAAVYDDRKYTQEVMEVGVKSHMVILEDVDREAFKLLDQILSNTSSSNLLAKRIVHDSSKSDSSHKNVLALKTIEFTSSGFVFVREDGSSGELKFNTRLGLSKRVLILQELWKNRRIYLKEKIRREGDEISLANLKQIARSASERSLDGEIKQINELFKEKMINVSIVSLGTRRRLEVNLV